jgi:glycine cleavage system aminomethyltransferase T
MAACTLCAVSVTTGSAGSAASLDVVLQRAGAVLATRGGRPVAMNFGSAAAELAVCVRAVGLVDRSELSMLVLEAAPAQLAALTSRLVGDTVAPGGVLSAGNAWWCGDASGRVIVLTDPDTGARLHERLHVDARRFAGITARDASAELAAIGLLGRSASDVLRALGAYGEAGDPRAVAPFTHGQIAGIPASWLLQSDRRALALVPQEHAGEAWLAIERAGRPFGISCVGFEAACRYALLERTRPAAPPFG